MDITPIPSLPCPAYVTELIARLTAHGYEACLVGGSLRDLLLGQTPHDFDITTSALPQQTMEVFADTYTVLPTGLPHGTVTVLVPMSDGHREPVEVTTYRIDGTYSDSRRPDHVTFTPSLTEDLARRDFTVNAMAFCPGQGIVDPFGGRQDLSDRLLRAVGDPVLRYREDALRILRGFRFAAQLDFALHPDTLSAAGVCREGLTRISAERIWSEFSRLLAAPAPGRSLSLMTGVGVLPFVLPHSAQTVWEGREDVSQTIDRLTQNPSYRLAWLLFHAQPESVAADLTFLKVSGETARTVKTLCLGRTAPLPVDPPAARRYIRRFGSLAVGALTLLDADCRSRHDPLLSQTEVALDLVRETEQQNFPRTVGELAVNGQDLMAHGIRGRDIGKTLTALLEYVTDHPEENRKPSLLARLP